MPRDTVRRRVLAAVVAAAAIGLVMLLPRNAEAQVVYSNDFETGVAGPEWSSGPNLTQPGRVDITPSGRRFLGRFGAEAARLRLTQLPSITINRSSQQTSNRCFTHAAWPS